MCVKYTLVFLVYSSCRDGNGRWKADFAYTRPVDCAEGVYYECETEGIVGKAITTSVSYLHPILLLCAGIERRRICSTEGNAFNYLTRRCEPYHERICQLLRKI